jgi:hypothetical protein
LGVLTIPTGHDPQPADSLTAKASVRKPEGVICRTDRGGVCSDVRALSSVAVVVPISEMFNASGLESQPSGSTGKLSRPATVNELKFPPAKAAQR